MVCEECIWNLSVIEVRSFSDNAISMRKAYNKQFPENLMYYWNLLFRWHDDSDYSIIYLILDENLNIFHVCIIRFCYDQIKRVNSSASKNSGRMLTTHAICLPNLRISNTHRLCVFQLKHNSPHTFLLSAQSDAMNHMRNIIFHICVRDSRVSFWMMTKYSKTRISGI